MTKIDKTDISNIKLIIKETSLKGISKVRIKKNNYEIEITSENLVNTKKISQIAETPSDRGEKLKIDNPEIDSELTQIIDKEDLDEDQRKKVEQALKGNYPIMTSEKRLE